MRIIDLQEAQRLVHFIPVLPRGHSILQGKCKVIDTKSATENVDLADREQELRHRIAGRSVLTTDPSTYR